MTLLLSEFPFELLQRVIVFAGSDVKTLLRCERTCHAFRNVVANDMTWNEVPALERLVQMIHPNFRDNFEPLSLSFFKSRREFTSATFAIANVWWNQVHSSENVFAHYLGADGFETFIQAEPRLCAPERNHVCEFLQRFAGIDMEFSRFVFRRDTLDTLAEIVHHTMISVLSRAHDVSCAVASATDTFPIMKEEDFFHGTAGFIKDLLPTDNDLVDASLQLLPEATRDAIVRRLSHLAGVVRMTNQVYKLAWATLVHTILLLIRPGCMKMVGANPREAIDEDGKRVLSKNESIRTVPPHSVPGICTECMEVILIHKIVPQQIQDAAKELGLVDTVYGDFWFIGEVICEHSEDHWEQARDALMSKAEEDYEFEEESDEEEEEDLNMDYYEEDTMERQQQGNSASDHDSDLEEEEEDSAMFLPLPRDSMESYGGSETEREDETAFEDDSDAALEDFVDQFENVDMME